MAGDKLLWLGGTCPVLAWWESQNPPWATPGFRSEKRAAWTLWAGPGVSIDICGLRRILKHGISRATTGSPVTVAMMISDLFLRFSACLITRRMSETDGDGPCDWSRRPPFAPLPGMAGGFGLSGMRAAHTTSRRPRDEQRRGESVGHAFVPIVRVAPVEQPGGESWRGGMGRSGRRWCES